MGQHDQDLSFSRGQRQGIVLRGAGSVAGGFVVHADEQGPAPGIAGDQWDHGHSLPGFGGALHPGLLGRRDIAGPCCGHGRTVAGAKRSGAVEGQAMEDPVALPAQDLLGSISQDALGPGVREDDVLVQVDGAGPVEGCFQLLQNVQAAAIFGTQTFAHSLHPGFCAHISHEL